MNSKLTNKIGGYRFIPIADRVVPAPVDFESLNLGRPHKDGSLSGTLSVRWTNETPLCIGRTVRSGGQQTVVPMRIDGTPVIPGSTLKGMVRAVLEIASFSGLGPFDSHRHYGFRTIGTKDLLRESLDDPNRVFAGWLTLETRKGDDGSERLCWVFRKAGGNGEFRRVPFDQVIGDVGLADPNLWKVLNTRDKVTRLGSSSSGWTGMERVRNIPGVRIGLGGDRGKVERVRGSGEIEGYLVPGGPCPDDIKDNPKANEHFFEPPKKGDAGIVLREDFVELFSRMHSNPGRDRPTPRDGWRFWLVQMGYDRQAQNLIFQFERDDGEAPVDGFAPPGIPMFFHGEPAAASEDDASLRASEVGFCMGLSRVLRFPYWRSLGEVAGRVYAREGDDGELKGNFVANKSLDGTGDPVFSYRAPDLARKGWFDITRAMFGDMDQAEEENGADGPDSPQDKPPAMALSSRVRFSCAFAENDKGSTDPRDLVFGQPRPSFYRAYLQQEGKEAVDFDRSQARLSGRKRYPVRRRPNPEPPAKDKPDTQTRVAFLNSGHEFNGEVRFHNLHPVELGALIWALTFGDPGGRFRHACGRGKAFGYGCLRAEVAFSGKLRAANLPADAATDLDAWIGTFEDYVLGKLKSGKSRDFGSLSIVSRLRAMADPEIGEDYSAHLKYPPVEDYKELKEAGIGHVLDDEVWEAN